jgi:hypothetical protein
MDRDAFYNVMRDKFGALSQSQVNGTNALLDEGEKRKLPMNQLAYVLSTSWHETAATMMPIEEYGKGEGHEYGEPCPEYNNQVAYGRGYVQLTWDYNYERADGELDLNGALLDDFDLALDPIIASAIIFTGMGEGWFTGKKLTDYVNDEVTDYVNARRVVNGTDKADMLAGYAENFEAALRAANYGASTPVDPDEITNPPEEVEHPEPEMPQIWFEYKVTSYDEATLNTMGSAGWRLAHIRGESAIWERMVD